MKKSLGRDSSVSLPEAGAVKSLPDYPCLRFAEKGQMIVIQPPRRLSEEELVELARDEMLRIALGSINIH